MILRNALLQIAVKEYSNMPTSDIVTTTAVELADRIGAAHRDFEALVESVDNGVVANGWSARDTAAHLLTVINRYNEFSPDRLAADPRGVDSINAVEMAAWASASTGECLDQLRCEIATFDQRWGAASGIPLDFPFPFHGGATIDYQAAMTNALAEFVMHGYDLATAAGVPWPVHARDAELFCGFGSQILPAYVRAGFAGTAAIEVRVSGMLPWVLHVDGPVRRSALLHANDAPTMTVEADPATFILAAYGRLDATAAASRGMRIGGSTPIAFDLLLERP
jgi:hypothetical protein